VTRKNSTNFDSHEPSSFPIPPFPGVQYAPRVPQRGAAGGGCSVRVRRRRHGSDAVATATRTPRARVTPPVSALGAPDAATPRRRRGRCVRRAARACAAPPARTCRREVACYVHGARRAAASRPVPDVAVAGRAADAMPRAMARVAGPKLLGHNPVPLGKTQRWLQATTFDASEVLHTPGARRGAWGACSRAAPAG